LYRTNAQSLTLERALLQLRVPYQIIGGVRFYDRKVVKDVLAYVKLLYQPHDRMSFTRIANVPTRGVGATSLDRFLVWQSQSGLTIIEAMQRMASEPVVTGKARTALATLGEKLFALQQRIEDTDPAELVEAIVTAVGYRDYISDGSPQSEDNLENIGSLISDAQNFTALADFLEEVSLMSSVDSQTSDDKVVLMTLHAAKGLEFPVVFMVGMEEGLLPHSRVFESGPAELEEERRLCYVGMTRAREELHLSYAYSRLQYGNRAYNPVSRFISDMGSSVAMTNPEPQLMGYQPDEPFYSDEIGFDVGDRVRSAAFGDGEIIDVDGLAVTVAFISGQTKKLNAEYAHLQKL